MDLPLPPPPTMTLQHHQLQVTSPPTIQLKPAPPPRSQQSNLGQNPQQQQHRYSPNPRQPNDKSQEEWLRDGGHKSLQDFMDYYGFNMNDPEDMKMGKGFLDQIRKQEQEVWQQAQTQPPHPQAQQQRLQVNGRAYSSNSISRPSSNSSNHASLPRYSDDPILNNNNAYNIKTFPPLQQQQPQQPQHHPSVHSSPYRPHSQQQQQHQPQQTSMKHMQMHIPRSTGSADQAVANRFHTAAVNRAFNENVLNAYGIKPWEVEATGKLQAEFAKFER